MLHIPCPTVFVVAHEMLDVTEGEFERDRGVAQAEPLPPARPAPVGRIEGIALPAELQAMVDQLIAWQREPHDVADALLGGRFAQAAYRAQLMPLIGDAQAQSLQGATGNLARLPWRVQWQAELRTCGDEHVQALSAGTVQPLNPQLLRLHPTQ